MALSERKRIRLKDYDYSQNGAYFITICTKDRKHLLWNVGATCGRPDDKSVLSDVGRIANNEIKRISAIYKDIKVEKSVVMPNHIHLIILINCEHSGRPQDAPTISRIVQQFNGSISKQVGFPLWQRSFYEHIIRCEKDYLETWDYINTNPQKWAEDEYHDYQQEHSLPRG